LTWKEVYEIDSEFRSLIKAETIKKEMLDARIQKLKFTHSQAAQIELKQAEMERAELVQKRFGETEPGITYQTFNEYDKLFNGKS
jgi:hypothetical protein